MVVVAAVHRPRALAVLPDLVLLGGHLAQFAEDLLAGTAAGGELAIDAVALGVGIEVEEVAHGLLLLASVGRCRQSYVFSPDVGRASPSSLEAP